MPVLTIAISLISVKSILTKISHDNHQQRMQTIWITQMHRLRSNSTTQTKLYQSKTTTTSFINDNNHEYQHNVTSNHQQQRINHYTHNLQSCPNNGPTFNAHTNANEKKEAPWGKLLIARKAFESQNRRKQLMLNRKQSRWGRTRCNLLKAKQTAQMRRQSHSCSPSRHTLPYPGLRHPTPPHITMHCENGFQLHTRILLGS